MTEPFTLHPDLPIGVHVHLYTNTSDNTMYADPYTYSYHISINVYIK